jgi:hypothetical protein
MMSMTNCVAPTLGVDGVAGVADAVGEEGELLERS